MMPFFWSGISVCLCVFMKWCFSPYRKLTWQSQVWPSLLSVKRWSTSPNLSWPSESASCTASTWWVSSHKGKPSDKLKTYLSRLPDVSNCWKKNNSQLICLVSLFARLNVFVISPLWNLLAFLHLSAAGLSFLCVLSSSWFTPPAMFQLPSLQLQFLNVFWCFSLLVFCHIFSFCSFAPPSCQHQMVCWTVWTS